MNNNNNDSINNALKFRRNLYQVFNSKEGKEVIRYLEEAYVSNTALDEDTNKTMYRLGMKEFVQALIKDATTKQEDLEHLLTGENYNE